MSGGMPSTRLAFCWSLGLIRELMPALGLTRIAKRHRVSCGIRWAAKCAPQVAFCLGLEVGGGSCRMASRNKTPSTPSRSGSPGSFRSP
jgi:hypothetical protein